MFSGLREEPVDGIINLGAGTPQLAAVISLVDSAAAEGKQWYVLAHLSYLLQLTSCVSLVSQTG